MKTFVFLCVIALALAGPTPCQKQRAKAMKAHMIGSFVPQCDKNDGSFKPMQCSGSTGYCWCVDTTSGDKIVGSAARGSVDCTANKTATTKCEKQRQAVLNKGAMVGSFVPKCDAAGNFEAEQCWGSTGFCWCVDTTSGVKLVGTEQRGSADCSKTACQKQRDTAMANEKKGMVGGMIPKCDNKGDFSPMQCSGSTGYCWCVDTKTGVEVVGSSVRGTPECGKPQSACEKKRAAVLAKGLIGAVVPSCDNTTGDYTPVQCSGSTGYCWCVDTKSGDKVVGTDQRGEAGLDCTAPKKQTPCQTQLAKAKGSKNLIGAFVPACDANGDFKKMQCSGSTGFCWCVNPKTGKKVVGSDVRGTAKC